MHMEQATKRAIPTMHRMLPIVMAMVPLAFTACKHEPQLEPLVPPVNDDGGGGGDPQPCDPGTVYFQQQVLPILTSNCTNPAPGLNCHHTANDENDWIQITSYESLMNSGVVQDGDLWEAINDDDPDKVMPRPPAPPLTPAQIALIGQWIQQGAQNNSCESAGCDTLNVTYSQTIVPILQARCISCHSGPSPQGALDFTAWSVVNMVAMDGRLEAAITHAPQAAAMPPTGPMLPDCQIQQFLLWIDAGAPNN